MVIAVTGAIDPHCNNAVLALTHRDGGEHFQTLYPDELRQILGARLVGGTSLGRP